MFETVHITLISADPIRAACVNTSW